MRVAATMAAMAITLQSSFTSLSLSSNSSLGYRFSPTFCPPLVRYVLLSNFVSTLSFNQENSCLLKLPVDSFYCFFFQFSLLVLRSCGDNTRWVSPNLDWLYFLGHVNVLHWVIPLYGASFGLFDCNFWTGIAYMIHVCYYDYDTLIFSATFGLFVNDFLIGALPLLTQIHCFLN